MEKREQVISVKELSKVYITYPFEPPPVLLYRKISKTKAKPTHQVEALKNINFEVEKGELFGIIGPDGAGKTTLFRILATLILGDSGNVTVEGLDVVKHYETIRQIVGYMPGKFSLYEDLTVEENLRFFATLFETTVEENYALIADIYCQIEPFKDRFAGKLSGGMKQKLALCCALIHKPKVLFLDEPTTGVDPVSRKEFWGMLQRLKKEGITIVVSTPYMDEAILCDRIALINNGEILQINTPDEIISNYPSHLITIQGDDMYNMLLLLRQQAFVESCYAFGDQLHLSIHKSKNREDIIVQIKEILKSNGYMGASVKRATATIEDCFLAISQ